MCSSDDTQGPPDYYIRQFHDMKDTVDTEGMSPSTFRHYISASAYLWHDPLAEHECLNTAGYVPTHDTVLEAVAAWSYQYADSRSTISLNRARRPPQATSRVADDPAR